MQALTKDVKKEDLERAKNAAICQVLVNLESRAVVAEDIGRQVLTYGHRFASLSIQWRKKAGSETKEALIPFAVGC